MHEIKKTGIEWLPEISKDFSVGYVKQYFNISKDLSNEGEPERVLKLARSGIVEKDVTMNEGQMAASYAGYNKVLVGDLLLNPMDLYSGANCNVSQLDGVISPAYLNLRAKKVQTVVPKFYDYYFKTQYWIMAMFAHGKGVSFDNRWTLNNDSLRSYEIPVLPYLSQKRIVQKIQSEEQNVDALIANQQAQIEKLKQYKQSLITEVVTKGLDPDVPMKDSGVEWIGKIPNSWQIVRFRFIAKITTGNQDTQNATTDGNYPFYVRSPIVEKSDTYTFEGPGILMAGDGAGAGRIFHLVDGKYAVHQRVYRFYDFKFIVPELLKLFLETQFSTVMDYGSAKTTVPSVRLPMIQDFPVCIPTKAEQMMMITYLKNKIKKIDSLVAIKQEKIDKLNDYKKSLIYEYVTGKKEA